MPKPSFNFDEEYDKIKNSYVSQLGDEPQQTEPSQSGFDPEALKAAFVGGATGLTYGVAPYATEKVLELADKARQSDIGFIKNLGQDVIGDLQYKPGIVKDRLAQLRAESPNAYTTGEIAGSLAAPIPGLGMATSIPKAMAIQGGLGALQGYTTSEGETVEDRFKDALTGGYSGAVLGGVAQKGLQALPKGLDILKGLFSKADDVASDLPKAASIADNAPQDVLSKLKRGAAQVLGSTPDDARAIQANKVAIRAIEGEKAPFSQKIVDLAKKVQSDRNKFAEAARATLGDEPKFTAEMVKSSFDDILQANRKVNVDTNEMIPKNLDVDRALAQISEEVDRVGTVSEKELKDLTLKYIDGNINYEPKSSADIEVNNTLKEVRRRVDGILKQNKNYEQAMKEVAPRQNLLDSILPKYGLDEKMTGGLQESDRLTGAIKKLGDERKIDTARDFINLGRLANDNPLQELKGGAGLVREARLRSLVDRNEAGVTNGSRNVNTFTALGRAILPRLVTGAAGGTVGGIVGGDAGAAAGATAGFMIDKQGRNIAKNLLLSGVPAKSIIENTVQPGVSKIAQFSGTQFYPAFVNAMRTGNYIATDFILNTNPEYRAIKERAKKNEQTK